MPEYNIWNNIKVMFGMNGNNVTNLKFIGRRDMNMDPNIKALFDESDEYYYYPYFNDAKELLWFYLKFISFK